MTTTHQVFDDYFPRDFFIRLRNKVYNPAFQWQFSSKLNDSQDKDDDSVYFVQTIYQDHEPRSFLWEDIKYILNNHFNALGLFRSKVNFYLRTKTLVEHAPHRAMEIPHKGAIIYLNTCDGFTRLEDGTKIESVENRILFFDPLTLHNSTSTTDQPGRFNININYI